MRHMPHMYIHMPAYLLNTLNDQIHIYEFVGDYES